jgi:N-acetylglucosamine kinase
MSWAESIHLLKILVNFASFSAADSAPICNSIAGVIHPLTTKVKSANVPCISGRALASELGAYLKRPVYVVNDANALHWPKLDSVRRKP